MKVSIVTLALSTVVAVNDSLDSEIFSTADTGLSWSQLGTRPNFKPIVYYSRPSIVIDRKSISKFSTKYSQYQQSENKSKIGEKWVWKSVSFQVEIRTDL